MDIQRQGIIINTEKYEECIKFYRELFELPLMFEREKGTFRLSCFEFGSCYLMVETGGFASNTGKSIKSCPMKLRFNVSNIDLALKKVNAFGIDAKIEENDWGSTINIYDPDGNRVGIRDENGFRKQIRT
jgi:lactoylglutathione lyase